MSSPNKPENIDFTKKNSVSANFSATPDSGLLPDVAKGSLADKISHSKSLNSTIQTPSGRDLIAEAMGVSATASYGMSSEGDAFEPINSHNVKYMDKNQRKAYGLAVMYVGELSHLSIDEITDSTTSKHENGHISIGMQLEFADKIDAAMLNELSENLKEHSDKFSFTTVGLNTIRLNNPVDEQGAPIIMKNSEFAKSILKAVSAMSYEGEVGFSRLRTDSVSLEQDWVNDPKGTAILDRITELGQENILEQVKELREDFIIGHHVELYHGYHMPGEDKTCIQTRERAQRHEEGLDRSGNKTYTVHDTLGLR